VIVTLAVSWGGVFAGALHGQSPAILAPQTLYNDGYVQCTQGGVAVAGCPVTLTSAPVSNTNGHLHGGVPHPVTGLCAGSCSASGVFSSSISGITGSDGNFYFTSYTTLIGQQEQLTVTSSDPAISLPPVDSYFVGYGDLTAASNSAWIQVGGNNTGHGGNGNNHYMTSAAQSALQATTAAWSTATGNCNICINDAAL
jgi:hypothetical protein